MPTPSNAGPDFQPDFQPDFRVNQLEDDAIREGFDEHGILLDYDAVECVAKKVTDRETQRSRYFIKAYYGGPESGHFYNPKSLYGPSSLHGRSRGGMSAFVWRPVNAETFDSYLRFLATKNPMHYREAERNSCQS